ncbi:MAG: DUF2779 domain-containing protein, partial [Deltaproteobacteria bacterium]|nr:DUF2779 domain-containing protein [Deltaproteobacteria bacterium]
MPYGLSKSKILSGRQCLKRLWLEVHQPELAQQSEASAQVIQAGFEAHEVARGLFPGGTLIEYGGDLRTALEDTRKALEHSPETPLFEGTFEHAGVLVRTDLLFPDPAAARLVEVKSASEVKNYHIDDCAVQAWVLEGAGVLL